jgi:hypothetical protein
MSFARCVGTKQVGSALGSHRAGDVEQQHQSAQPNLPGCSNDMKALTVIPPEFREHFPKGNRIF